MTKTTLPALHPDDLLFYNEVREAMQRVARDYGLPLRSIEPLPMPTKAMADRLGDCSSTGDIRLVMRATENGQWVEAPRTPDKVWLTAAHELAHLRHFNHGDGHAQLTIELLAALKNKQEDHREKVLRKLVKMQAQRDDAARRAEKTGASEAQAEAEAFAAAINRMLIEYELNPTDIDYARATDNDPIIELRVDLARYAIEASKTRSAWQEALARTVAKAHLCTSLLRSGSNQIWFVGTKSHATVAEYVYGTLVPIAEKMSLRARHNFREELRRKYGIPSGRSIPSSVPESRGYREAWLSSFVERINERFEEERRRIVAEADARRPSDLPVGSESMALVRLNGAMVKVQSYIDDKFKARRGASALVQKYGRNAAGRAAGREAANRIAIGRKAVEGAATRGLLR